MILKNKAFIICLYIIVVLTANISSYRIIETWGLAWDGGAVVFPVVFILRDYIHHYHGRQVAKELIPISIFSIALFYLGIYFVSLLPSAVGEDHFSTVMLQSARIFISSLACLALMEILNVIIYQKHIGKRAKAMFISNNATVPIDTILFMFLAFFGVMTMDQIYSSIVVNIVIKLFMVNVVAGYHYLTARQKGRS